MRWNEVIASVRSRNMILTLPAPTYLVGLCGDAIFIPFEKAPPTQGLQCIQKVDPRWKKYDRVMQQKTEHELRVSP